MAGMIDPEGIWVNYGFDTIFHLTVDSEEYRFTDGICKKYIKEYKGEKDGE